jgi:hypothetical protein
MFAIPKIFRTGAKAEVSLEKVTEGWPVGTDLEAHVKVLAICSRAPPQEFASIRAKAIRSRVIDFYGKKVLPRLRSISRKAA